MQVVILGDKFYFGLEPGTAKVFVDNLEAMAYLENISYLDDEGTTWYKHSWTTYSFSEYVNYENISITKSEKFIVFFFDKNEQIPFGAYFVASSYNSARRLIETNYLQTCSEDEPITYKIKGVTYYDYAIYQIQDVEKPQCVFESNLM